MRTYQTALLLAVFCLTVSLSAFSVPDQPNIVWLCGEDLGAQLTQYGHDQVETPNIDRLASDSLTYEVAWSNAPVCAPARTTLGTGMYATSLGAEHMRCWAQTPEKFRLYPNHLRKAGYETVNHGKEDYNVPHNNLWSSNATLSDADEPFFMKLNYGKTHESGVGHANSQVSGEVGRYDIPEFHPDIPEIHRNWATYYHKIETFDDWVGDRLETLKTNDLLDETIVVIWGDHGPGLPFGKRFARDFGLRVPLIVYVPPKYREKYAPSEYKPGGKTDRPVSFVDFGPTMISIAGKETPEYMHGRAFMGPHEEEPRDYVFGFRGRMDERIDMVRTVRDERYELIRNYMPHRIHGQYLVYLYNNKALPAWQKKYEEGKTEPPSSFYWMEKPPIELYDLKNDPDAVRNLAYHTEYQDVRERLMNRLREHQKNVRDVGFLPETEIRRHSKKGESPYEMAQDSDRYPLDDLMNVAEAAARRDMESLTMLARLLDHSHPAIRYWAATGFLVRGQHAVWPFRDRLRALMRGDEAPTARVVAAEALARYGNSTDRKQALQVLMELGNNHKHNQFTAIAALNAVDKLDQIASPVLFQILKLPLWPDNGPRRGQKYTMRLLRKIRSDLMDFESRLKTVPSDHLINAVGEPGGLTGTYFHGTDFGEKRFERTDETIDFDWGKKAPRDGMEPDRFSVRWTGQIRPKTSGEHVFATWSNDGVRLWVNGKQLIEDWHGHMTQRNLGAIRLEAGKTCDITLEYYEGSGSADVRLGWALLPSNK